MQGYIKVTSMYETFQMLHINVATISAIYRIKEKKKNPDDPDTYYTVIRTTAPIDELFHVKEPVDYVLRLINEAAWSSTTQ